MPANAASAQSPLVNLCWGWAGSTIGVLVNNNNAPNIIVLTPKRHASNKNIGMVAMRNLLVTTLMLIVV